MQVNSPTCCGVLEPTTTAMASSTSTTRAAAVPSTPPSTTPPPPGARAAAPPLPAVRQHHDDRRWDDDHEWWLEHTAAARPASSTAKAGKKTVGGRRRGSSASRPRRVRAPSRSRKTQKGKIEHPTLRRTAPPPTPTRALRRAMRSASPTSSSTPSRSRPLFSPIYQSCGTEYGIPWQVLAGINKIETAFGTNLNVSSAGAEGWMQFIPSTWAYGVDANNDGKRYPYNPLYGILRRLLPARRRRLHIRQVIFAYAHVDEVLLYANLGSPTPWSARSPVSPREPTSPSPRMPATPTTSTTPRAHPVDARARAAGNAACGQLHDAATKTSTSTRARALRGRGQRWGHQEDRGQRQGARQVHRSRGRLRQPLHLLATSGHLADASGASSAGGSGAPAREAQQDLPTPTAAASAGDNSGGLGEGGRAGDSQRPGQLRDAAQRRPSPADRSGNADQSERTDRPASRRVPGYETSSGLSSSVQFDPTPCS